MNPALFRTLFMDQTVVSPGLPLLITAGTSSVVL